jgi:1-acyl-sn-glycerol-3-phosphate acyltransferase
MTNAAIWARSWIYLIAFLLWTICLSVVCLPALTRRAWAVGAIRAWVRGIMVLARTLVRIDCRILDRHNLPDGACIIAAQHQSSFETYRLFLELKQPVFVLKRELTYIPIVGWYMRRGGLVPIDRGAGAKAMRKMLRAADAALGRGEQVIIFPEGTRTAPGEHKPYRPGVAALYAHCQAPVIPLALNSGYAWGKTRILKRPGTILFRFMPALPQGLDREAMLSALRTEIAAANLPLTG